MLGVLHRSVVGTQHCDERPMYMCMYIQLFDVGSSKHGEASEAVQISAETPGEVGSRCVWCELNLARTIYVHVHVFT